MKKQQKKKQTAGIRKILKLKPTCFSAMALLILLVLAFQVWHRDENPHSEKEQLHHSVPGGIRGADAGVPNRGFLPKSIILTTKK